MRLRILTPPPETLAGISPAHFKVGGIYEIRLHVACVYLARGWAEAVVSKAVAAMVPYTEALIQIKAAVLVLDDESTLRRFAAQLLAYRGYRAVVTRPGEEAIEQVGQRCHNVMLLDLTTPSVSGCKFRVEELYLTHARVAPTPLLLRSDENEAAATDARVEAMAVVKTPFDADALLQALA